MKFKVERASVFSSDQNPETLKIDPRYTVYTVQDTNVPTLWYDNYVELEPEDLLQFVKLHGRIVLEFVDANEEQPCITIYDDYLE